MKPALIHDVGDLTDRLMAFRDVGPIAFVPTMGALHEGHGALVREARRRATCVVASIFVNPAQFGPTEDLDRYPRDLEGDMERLASWDCDILYAPVARTMYPMGLEAFRVVPPGRLSDFWCGAARPGHLAGVSTVVLKLLMQVRPDLALFGQKDYQQWAVVDCLARDFGLGTTILRHPTVREVDGLALSSRNAYLSGQDRQRAQVLSRSLAAVLRAWKDGERDTLRLQAAGLAAWQGCREAWPGLPDPEYLEVRSADLAPAMLLEGPGVAAVAARIGPARLIDNVVLADPSPDEGLLAVPGGILT